MENNPTLALVSLGCAKNAVDLQVLAGDYLAKGYMLSSNPDRADVVIINTCSFIAAAREETEGEIRRALELKARGAYGRVVVTGCYPERYPKAVFSGVDEWRGVPHKWHESRVAGFRLTGPAFAYLKIAEGCQHHCAYCAIPLIRGKYRSRPRKAILAEASALIKSGCRELIIVAQDPMLYQPSLTDLLYDIDLIEGDFWIRVLYSYPSEISPDFIEWMNLSRHSVKYIDVPIQHTDPAVLKKMNRANAIEASRNAAEVLRKLVPGVTLRTTVMTGFPGESENRFNRMRADLKRMQFDHLGAFAFSAEEGTMAAKMKARPSRAVAEERERLIMSDAAMIWKAKAKRMIGSVHRVLVVARGVARMASQAPDVDGVTYVNSNAVGEFINVKLKRVSGFDFIAEVV